MPYKDSNAEWLQKLSMYDLLLMMQRGVEKACCIGITPCVMCGIDINQEYDRCRRYGGKCENCIADWLGEKHGGNE